MARKTTDQGDKVDKPKSFEKAMERLESIVGKMEGGSLNLEDMISAFEEGQTLIKFCTTKLNEVEKRIEVLVEKDDKITTEPLDPADDAEPDAAADGELF